MEALFEKFEKWNGYIDEISRQEKEQRDVEGVDQLMDKQGYGFKIVVPQNHQQNADTPRDIKVFDSLGHWNVSLALILPREPENLDRSSSSPPRTAA